MTRLKCPVRNCRSHVDPTPKALYDHLYIVHRLRGDELRAVEARVYDAEEAYSIRLTCAHCHRMLATPGGRRTHERTCAMNPESVAHQNEQSDAWGRVKVLHCPIDGCGGAVTGKHARMSLRRHLRDLHGIERECELQRLAVLADAASTYRDRPRPSRTNADDAIRALGPDPTPEELVLLLYPEPYRWSLLMISRASGHSDGVIGRVAQRLARQGRLEMRDRSDARYTYIERRVEEAIQ